MQSIPTSFNIQLSKAELQLVVEEAKKKIDEEEYVEYIVLTETYGDTLARAFNKTNKACVIAFTKAKIREPHQTTHAFLRIYGTCKGRDCQVNYSFTVRDIPPQNAEVVVVNVRKQGNRNINHSKEERLKRPLKGQARKEAKELLKIKKPSKLLREKFALADSEQIDFGNLDLVKTLKVYQQVRTQV